MTFSMQRQRRIARRAFTLVELLVVIAIIGVLVALLLPAVQAAREAARRTQCTNNIKQLALGCQNFASTQKTLPYGAKRSNGLSWTAYLLPYLEEATIYDQLSAGNAFKDGTVIGGTNNEGNAATGAPSPHKALLYAVLYEIPTFHCPTGNTDFFEVHSGKGDEPPKGSSGQLLDGRYAWNTHYIGVMGPVGKNPMTITPLNPTGTNYPFDSTLKYALDGVFQNNKSVKLKEITDGLSKTLLLGERSGDNITYFTDGWLTGFIGATNTYSCNIKNIEFSLNTPYASTAGNSHPFSSKHAGGAFFATCDGAVSFYSDDIALTTLLALASKGSADIVP